MKPTTLNITHPNGSYDIFIGRNLLTSMRSLTGLDAPYVVVTDSNVEPLYANLFADASAIISVHAGEANKNLKTVSYLYKQFIRAGLDRTGFVLALGGGVVGDMAGFAAASYMRGVRFVQCPTTILSMVDSSVGGKTGVDLPEGKNLIGAFKQPEAVIVDLDVLQTLPPEEISSGFAEVIKHGFIKDPTLLETIRAYDGAEAIPTWSEIQGLIERAIEVKRQIVQEDPYEHGVRATLNLGHTFGHAIEQVSGYKVSHGFAVGMGLMVAARVSAETLKVPDQTEDVELLLDKVGLKAEIPSNLAADDIIAAMQTDKKKQRGTVRYILLRGMGDCFVSADVETALVKRILGELSTGPEVVLDEPKQAKRQKHFYKQVSKKLSHMLRHRPDRYGVTLDAAGWTDLDGALNVLKERRPIWRDLGVADIENIIANSSKTRFEIKDGKIRALYGHSTAEKIEKVSAEPPDILYHGTTPQVVDIILKDGLKSMKRQYVHLSLDVPTAIIVGKRRSKTPTILAIRAREAFAAGVPFYAEKNGIWLSEPIPAQYIGVDSAE